MPARKSRRSSNSLLSRFPLIGLSWREHAQLSPVGEPYLDVAGMSDDDDELSMWTFGFLVKETPTHYHVASTIGGASKIECSTTMIVDKNSVLKATRL